MRIKLFILTFLFLFFGARPTFAVIEFNISNPQNNGGEVTLDVSISGLTSSSCLNNLCYLQAAFTSTSPIRYFGFTKNNNGQWYEYTSSPGSDYIQSTFFAFEPTNGGWSGQLAVKINTENPNYKGSGEYNLKAWRYSGNSNSYSGDSDNTLSINIEGQATPTPNPTPSPTPTPSPVSTKTPAPTPTPKKTATPTSTPTSIPNPTPKNTLIPSSTKKESSAQPNNSEEINYRIASVAAATTSSAPEGKIEVKTQKQTNPLIWVGIIFIFAGVSLLGYIYVKKNEKIRVWFRR